MSWITRSELRGPVGTFDAVTVSYLPTGSVPNATIGGTAEFRTVHFALPEGPRGLPGVLAVENDEAVATYMRAIGSDTNSALVTMYGQIFTPEAYGAVGDGSSDDSVALQAAYDAACAAGGGTVLLTNNYLVSTPLLLNQAVSVEVSGYGAKLICGGTDWAVQFSAGSAATQSITSLAGVVIDGAGIGNGVKILNHFAPTLRDVRVNHADCGILFTAESGGWSESSVFDNVTTDWCNVGIDFEAENGTGSYGYLAWGFVGIYNVPDDGIGFRVRSGAFLYHSNIAQLVVQIQGDNAVGWDISGVMGRNSAVHTIIESSPSPFTIRTGMELAGSAVLDGLALRAYFHGSYSDKILNPSNIPFQMRDAADHSLRGNATSTALLGFGAFGDTHDRVQIRGDRILFGSGSANPDSAIVRFGEKQLGIDLGVQFRIDGTWQAPLRMGPSNAAYRLWVDSAGKLRIKAGTPDSDTDGSVVGAQS